jgi:hypothetical protein
VVLVPSDIDIYLAALPTLCLQQRIADRKSKMLAIDLDDLREVSV